MNEVQAFAHQDYRSYLVARLQITGATRGLRSRLADYLGVQGAFVSQVLSGKLHFGLEQAIKISEFLEHSEEEADYFLLLLHKGRAGSVKLADYYEKKLHAIHERRQEIKSRVQTTESISESDEARYFSTWIYAAMHVLLTIPQYQSRRAISQRLGLSAAVVERHLQFLLRIGVAEENAGRISVGKTRIHISNENPNILKHHANWRSRSLQALEKEEKEEQRYTCAMSLAKADAEKIRALWLGLLEKIEPLISASPEEELYALTWDFFKV